MNRAVGSLGVVLVLLGTGCSCDSNVATPRDGGDPPTGDAALPPPPEDGGAAGDDGGMATDAGASVDAGSAEDGGPMDGGPMGLDGGPATTDGGPADGGPMGMDAGPACMDDDMDGVTDCAGDCDDTDPLTYPGATEVCGDGIDNACGSDPDPASLCAAIGTHVSPAGSDATGDGTRANPVRSIAQGIMNAVTIGGPTTVVVAGGTYAESVTVVEGVSIQGGFACASLPCSWTHSPGSETSTIAAPGTDDGVAIGDTITRATELSHLTITSSREGIAIRGGAPTLRHLDITGRSGISAFRAGTDPLIEDSVVLGTGNSGIDIEGSGTVRRCDVEGPRGMSLRGDPIVEHSVVHGTGEGGITIWEGTPQILANLVNTDASRAGTCSSGFCFGIAIWGGSPYIANNVVYGLGGAQSAAISILHGELEVREPIINSNTLFMAHPSSGGGLHAGIACESFFGIAMFGEIRNNVIVGASGGTNHVFYEVDPFDPAGTTCRPVLIENNVFHDIDHVARFHGGGGPEVFFTTLASAEAETWAADNIEGDPRLDATFHLMAGSPAIDQGVTTDAPSVDRDGDPRPSGSRHDIGADEVTP